ncbi:MAG: ABC transporter [Deltaproteobacteria bacterium CG2_30_63_29]|nr:MAG: ABC transporter [Deltaproteobacteria bacterium CG2_30_63_29]PJB42174.1 MAG: ABC transporter [Deltaproteobacteria bacterium CG_4_9_14_3_um_filter_63_12]
MIRLVGVSKRYGNFNAVANLDIEVQKGEVFGFLGPNGAGKTTTLRMLTGLIQPTTGEIFIGGFDVRKEALEAKKIMGYIPDRPYLYEKLTAFELMRFVAGLNRLVRTDAATRIPALLEQFGLAEWSDTLVENYSHGMKQRLVFAAALLPRPSVLVVDEPMVGLDPQGMRLVKGVFIDLCRDEGMTVFLSTHTLEVAEEVCQRIAILHRGEVVAMGNMATLRAATKAGDGRLEEVFFELTETQGNDVTTQEAS